MRMPNLIRLGVGLAIWAGIIGFVANVWAKDPVSSFQPVQQVQAYVFNEHFTITVPFDSRLPRTPSPGDAVRYNVVLDEARHLVEVRQIGEVADVRKQPDGTTDLVLHIFPHGRPYITRDLQFLAYTGPDNLDQIMQVLVDDRTGTRMQEEWQRFLDQRRGQLERMFKPLIEGALNDYIELISPDIEASFARRSDEFGDVFIAYWDGSVKDELLPMLEKKGMPQVEEKIVPIVRECGQELWENAPAGSFAWNAFRDKVVPWDSKTNLQERFDEWLRKDGRPIIDKYVPRMLEQGEEIGADLMTDPEVTRLLSDVLRKIINDPRLSQLLQEVIQEAIVDNPKTPGFLQDRWENPKLQDALRRVGLMIEPYANRAIDSILLDRDTGSVNPNLVTVLRSQILWKGDFWLLATPPREGGAHDPRLAPDGYRYPTEQTRHGFR